MTDLTIENNIGLIVGFAEQREYGLAQFAALFEHYSRGKEANFDGFPDNIIGTPTITRILECESLTFDYSQLEQDVLFDALPFEAQVKIVASYLLNNSQAIDGANPIYCEYVFEKKVQGVLIIPTSNHISDDFPSFISSSIVDREMMAERL